MWDSSTTLYLHNLLQGDIPGYILYFGLIEQHFYTNWHCSTASTQAEAVLFELESDSTSIELYLTINNIKVRFSHADDIYAVDIYIFFFLLKVSNTHVKGDCFKMYGFLSFFQICVNDDLVAKRFAYYITHPAGSTGLDGTDWLPVMLPSSILPQTVSKSSNRQKAQTEEVSCDRTGTTWENTTDVRTLNRMNRCRQIYTQVTASSEIFQNILLALLFIPYLKQLRLCSDWLSWRFNSNEQNVTDRKNVSHNWVFCSRSSFCSCQQVISIFHNKMSAVTNR